MADWVKDLQRQWQQFQGFADDETIRSDINLLCNEIERLEEEREMLMQRFDKCTRCGITVVHDE